MAVGTAPGAPPRLTGRTLRLAGVLAAAALLVVALALSVAVGTRAIPLDGLWAAVVTPGAPGYDLVHELRLPRTALGLEVGVALGVAGALMQALTRNPIADPGLLGVNAGAAGAMVVGVALLGTADLLASVWWAFAGAAAASVVVYVLGGTGRAAATPVRLALAGTAVSAAVSAFVSGMVLLDPDVLDVFRDWALGSLSGRRTVVAGELAPFVGVGLLLALLLARSLNALALGDEQARSLGLWLGRTRVLGAIAICLLCGAATAAAGPIAFVGLTVPHVARALVGQDLRWSMPLCALLGPALVLVADVCGRVLDRPGEVPVGLVCGVVGAPVFVALIRRARLGGTG